MSFERRAGRRVFLGGLAATFATGAAGIAVAHRRDAAPVLRVGVMANLSHAPLLAGIGSGRIAAALAPVGLEVRVFRAGPRVAEALAGGAIDAGTLGPAPLVMFHARRRGRGLRVITGCASGGASLVVAQGSGITRASDLRKKKVAVTQIGTTQDVALRAYLRDAGLRDASAGGDVTIVAISSATILAQMGVGDLDAAWLAEPWATRLVEEASAIRLVDERDRWTDGRFATAVLATRAETAHAESVRTLSLALDTEVERARLNPALAREEAFAELARRVGNAGARGVFDRAWDYVDFTSDPLRPTIEAFGDTAASFGLCPPHPAEGLFG